MYLQHNPTAYPLYVKEKCDPDIKFLDEVHEMLLDGNVSGAMDHLQEQLYQLYLTTSGKEWDELTESTLLRHPVARLLMQDPLTARAYAKPMGYSGDASLLDMIYFHHRHDISSASPIGKDIYRYTVRTQVCRSLTERIKKVAYLIDESCRTTSTPRILSVGCGHCRELQFSDGIKNNKTGQVVALDFDKQTLAKLGEMKTSTSILPVHASVSGIVKGEFEAGKFDLIYSSGLYDYLRNGTASRLTAILYRMLNPGGKLVIFNIETDYREIGYIESYMDWKMIGRDANDLLDIVSGINGSEIATLKTYTSDKNNSHFNRIEVTRQ